MLKGRSRNEKLERCDKRGNIFGPKTGNVDGNNSEFQYKSPFQKKLFLRNLYFPSNYSMSQDRFEILIKFMHFVDSNSGYIYRK
jgi:hypothetical protein